MAAAYLQSGEISHRISTVQGGELAGGGKNDHGHDLELSVRCERFDEVVAEGGCALARRLSLRPRVKGWLVAGDEFLMGPRYVRLLEEIDRRGSIREACAHIGLSYRTCLNRIRQMERVLGHPVIHTTRGGAGGGGSELTDEARDLVRLYRAWRTELDRSSDRLFRRLRRHG